MNNQSPDEQRFWKQWTPGERRKLEAHPEVINALRAGDIVTAQNIAIDIVQPKITDRKTAALARKISRMKNKIVDQQLRHK